MKAIRTICMSVLVAMSMTATAQKDETKWQEWGPTSKKNMGILFRAGYTIGGTSPIPVPSEIRKINKFSPRGGFNMGVEGYKMFGPRWGMSLGMYFAYQGFFTSANVKNYYMSYLDGDNVTKGWFTGVDETETTTTGLCIPVLATFRLSPRWNLSFGPYMHFFMNKHFSGQVYDNDEGVGYLRVDDGFGPTGDKVDITREKPVEYDMSEDMCGSNFGVEVMFDWKALKHMNVFGKLDWGIKSAFPSDFETVRFKMYPIYGTIGVAYRY